MTHPAPPAALAPVHARLPVAHARAARRAGALGGALVGVGLPIALSPLYALGIAALLRFVMTLPRSPDADVTPETIAVFEGIGDPLGTPVGIALAILCAVVGTALVVLGVVLAVRGMRRAGVHRAGGVAALGLLLARVATGVLGILLGGLTDVLVAVWFPPLLGIAFTDVFDDSSMPVPLLPVMIGASVLIAVVGIATAAGTWLGTGILTTWWMAVALRRRTPVGAAPSGLAQPHAPASGDLGWRPTSA